MATKKAFVRNKQLMKDLGVFVCAREERRKEERKAKKLAKRGVK